MNSRLLFACSALLFAAFVGPASDFPLLNISSQSTNLIVSWALLPQWVLEEASHLTPPAPWTLVSPDYYHSNGASRFVNYPAPAGNRFFRLRKTGLSVPGLKGYWGLDEGNGQASSDGTEFNSTLLFTNVSWGTGRIGPGALQFTGSPPGPSASLAWISNDTYRVLPPPANPWSLSLWLNPDALPSGWSGIAGNDATGTNGWQIALNNAGPGTNFFIFSGMGNSDSLSITGRFLLLPGQWRQLTVTHDGTKGSIYLDSALLAHGNGSLSTHDGPIYFGGGVANLNSFLGRIDDIRLYTNCLTYEQISLTGDWRFDEPTGQICEDSSIQGHVAVLTNASARVAGRNGTGVDLSASSITIGNSDYTILPPNGGSFSISFWLRPTTIEPGGSGLMKLGEGPTGGFELAFTTDDSGKTSLHLTSTNAGGTLDLIAPVPLTTGNWTKFDLTFNGGIATLYANGKQIRAINGAIRGTRSPLIIGAVPALSPFNGVIDDLRIYNRERGASEIGPIANTMWETVMLNSSTNLSLQGDGPPGRPLTYNIVPIITPTNGTVALSGGNTFTYSAGGRKGTDALTYTVSDGEFTSDPAIVTMSVVQPHWLSPTGGWIEPQDGSSPLQAWLAGPPDAMDAILKTNNYYDCFFYAPGEYQTRGWKYLERSTANPGCKHIGSGAESPTQTILKLVDVWGAWNEEVIFATFDGVSLCDNFEIQQMTLDCNATNVPKFTMGEPVTIKIPLASNNLVNAVTLRWANTSFYGNTFSLIGRAVEFSLRARKNGIYTYTTNCNFASSTNQVHSFSVGTEADELILELKRRAPGVDFYGLEEIDIQGNSASLPRATAPDGQESVLNVGYPIVSALDGKTTTAWASGPEEQVEIRLPLEPGTAVSQIDLSWNCKNIVGIGRLGPAASYTIWARNELAGTFYQIPFVASDRTTNGLEICSFGTAQSNAVIQTDQILIVLTSREAEIDYYSLKELSLANGLNPVSLRLPMATTTLDWILSTHILQAFDRNELTQWASGLQGMVGAVKVAGSNQKLAGLRVKGFGTKAGRECFPLFLTIPAAPGRTRNVGNVRVEDCVLSDPASANSDGLTALALVAVYPDTLTNAIIRRCTVLDMKPHFVYSQGMMASHVENCLVQNCQKGVYFEPHLVSGASVGPVLIRSNQFLNVDQGVFLAMYPRTGFEALTCLNNEILLEGSVLGYGIGACDTCFGGESGVVTNITALNNIIRYAGWGQQPGRSDIGLYYSDIPHAIFGNNLIAFGQPSGIRVRPYPSGIIYPNSPVEDCDHPGPFLPGNPTYTPSVDVLRHGYARAFFNNRNLSGASVEVRLKIFGTDGPALQQQWSEAIILP